MGASAVSTFAASCYGYRTQPHGDESLPQTATSQSLLQVVTAAAPNPTKANACLKQQGRTTEELSFRPWSSSDSI
ncbi:unnamed protein product, partial [Aphanomyces euteiches]